MRRPRVKITVGRMMVMVAVFAVSLEVGLAYRMSGEYMRQVRFHDRAEGVARFRADNVASGRMRLFNYTDEERRRVIVQQSSMRS